MRRFIREWTMASRIRNAALFMISAPSIYFAVSVYSHFRLEQRIAKEIEALGGIVDRNYHGPSWLPTQALAKSDVFLRIEGVDFMSNAVNADLISRLRSLPHLNRLVISGTVLTEEHMLAIGQLATISLLDLGSTGIGDTEFSRIKTLTKITWLSIENTRVSDNGMRVIADMPYVEILNINITHITDDGMWVIKGMERLITLTMNNTSITDIGLLRVDGLALRAVYAIGARTTAAGRASLRRVLPNCAIWPDP